MSTPTSQTSTPQWLLEAVTSAVTTKEYEEFSKAFADLLHQQLIQNHLTSFADLTEAERQPFIDTTMSKIATSQPNEALSGVLSSKIDESLHAFVGKQLLLDSVYSDSLSTRTDLQVDGLCDAVIAIVRQYPFLRFRLRVLFNCDIPKKLRPPIWHAFLQNPKIRRQYMNRIATDPRRGLSAMDGEIAKKCDSLLAEHVAFAKFKGSTGALYVMRTAISYYHNLVDAGNTLLAQSEFLLFCPLLYHVSTSIPRRQPPHPALITLLVEEYISLLESRPAFVCKPSLDDEQCKQFFICIADALQKLNPELVQLFAKWQARDLPEGFPSSLGVSPALAALTQPLVRNLFVGFVNYRVLLFIWDQYLLGIDVVGFACELLAIFVAILLHLASSAIIVGKCTNVADALDCIRENGQSVQVQQMRYTLHQYFGKRLANFMSSGGVLKGAADFAGQPPILLLSPGYDGKPADRLRERQLLEKVRQRQTEDDRKRDDEMKARLADLESTLQRRLNESEQRIGQAKQLFEDQLRAEREKRVQVEEHGAREAAALRAEIEQLRHDRDVLGRGANVAALAVPNRSADVSRSQIPLIPQTLPQAVPEVQNLIDLYLNRPSDVPNPVSTISLGNSLATALPVTSLAPSGTKIDLSATAPPSAIPIVSANPIPTDPRYDDPLKFVDMHSKAVLSGILGTAGPSAARLAHGGPTSVVTTPGFTVVNPTLDHDDQQFIDRMRAALERTEMQVFGRVFDTAAFAAMSEVDRQMAVTRILATVASTPSN